MVLTENGPYMQSMRIQIKFDKLVRVPAPSPNQSKPLPEQKPSVSVALENPSSSPKEETPLSLKALVKVNPSLSLKEENLLSLPTPLEIPVNPFFSMEYNISPSKALENPLSLIQEEAPSSSTAEGNLPYPTEDESPSSVAQKEEVYANAWRR